MARFTSSFFINWLTYEKPSKHVPLCDFDRICYEVRPCDVLLFEGRSRVSEVIKLVTQSSWSHSALYIGRLHDIEDPELREAAKQACAGDLNAQFVIEGVLGKGTVLTPLQEYKDDHIRICRPRGLSPKDAQNVVRYAINQLGTGYDVRQIFDLARLMFPWTIMPRHWRSRLFQQHAGVTTKTVCSTVIAEAFNSVDFPILPHVQHDDEKGIELIYRNPKLYTPSDFDYSPYFEIIKYPFVSFDAYYRKLPWNKDGLMSNDDVGITKFNKEASTSAEAFIEEVDDESNIVIKDKNKPNIDVDAECGELTRESTAPQDKKSPKKKSKVRSILTPKSKLKKKEKVGEPEAKEDESNSVHQTEDSKDAYFDAQNDNKENIEPPQVVSSSVMEPTASEERQTNEAMLSRLLFFVTPKSSKNV